jgi:deazaflavin-dependent oxidoreductase (nitroreductase family)
MALPKAAMPLFDFMASPRGRKIDGRLVKTTGHSLFSFLFSRNMGRSYRPPMALVTVGRRTGRLHTIAIAYNRREQDGVISVVGSAGGSDREPDWVTNLRSNPTAWVVIGRQEIPVLATILEGDDKAPWWDAITTRAPIFAEYQAGTERDIPVVVLRPYDVPAEAALRP